MRSLSGFESSLRIADKWRAIIWKILNVSLVKSNYCPNQVKRQLLRMNGAKIGSRVAFRSGLKVHFPWNLEIGDDCWIGEDVWFINHEKITIGSNVCISQRSIICSGGHDYRSSSLEFAHKPIQIKDGAWVCLDAKVLPGVTIGECSVISTGEVVRKSVPDFSMLIGGQIRPIEPPK